MCGYNCLYSYGYFLYMMHVCVYCYFSMNPCNYIMHFYIYILYIKFRNRFVCICFNCMQFENFMWDSSVGCWVCYNMFRREKKRVFSCSMPWHGWSGMLHLVCIFLCFSS
jgi:hypothetical protein